VVGGSINYFGGIGDTFEIQITKVKHGNKKEAGELTFITFKARCKKESTEKRN
jgi:hypothetical protein